MMLDQNHGASIAIFCENVTRALELGLSCIIKCTHFQQNKQKVKKIIENAVNVAANLALLV